MKVAWNTLLFTLLFTHGAIAQLSCGLDPLACPGMPTDSILGTGSLIAPGDFEAVFLPGYASKRTQLLYRKSELIGLGFSGGDAIIGLAFDVDQVPFGTANYQNFSIEMGCTSDTSLDVGSFLPTPYLVYQSSLLAIVSGWFSFSFIDPFVWSGNSNLVVNICYNNPVGGFTPAINLLASNVGYDALYSQYSDTSVCAAPLAPSSFVGSSSLRPNTLFSRCGNSVLSVRDLDGSIDDINIYPTGLINQYELRSIGDVIEEIVIFDTRGSLVNPTNLSYGQSSFFTIDAAPGFYLIKARAGSAERMLRVFVQ